MHSDKLQSWELILIFQQYTIFSTTTLPKKKKKKQTHTYYSIETKIKSECQTLSLKYHIAMFDFATVS
jgi:hypothetical protein